MIFEEALYGFSLRKEDLQGLFVFTIQYIP